MGNSNEQGRSSDEENVVQNAGKLELVLELFGSYNTKKNLLFLQ